MGAIEGLAAALQGAAPAAAWSVHDAALAYAALGWHVLPLKPRAKEPLARLAPHGARSATNDPATIRAWFTAEPDANLGVAVEPSGLLVVDIDPRNGGAETFDDLQTKLDGLRSDVVAFTGGNGEHVVFAAAPDVKPPGTLGPGVDVKANGYIVVEPSIHPSGRRYEWEASSNPLEGVVPSPLPESLRRLWGSRPERSGPTAAASLDRAELARVRSALCALDPGDADDRDTWLRIGMALHSTGWGEYAYREWLAYSQQSSKFDEADSRRVWASFTGSGVGLGTLFDAARRRGWVWQPAAPDIGPEPPPHAEEAGNAVQAPPAERFPLLTALQLAALPRMVWRVHSVLPSRGIAAMYGDSASGKTFIALDLAATLPEGGDWFGHRVKPCRVVYVVLEGEAGFRRRVEAWERSRGRPFPPDVLFLFVGFSIVERDDVLGLAAAIEAAGGAELVIVDTLNRAAPLADENSSRDMGAILEGAKELQATTGGLVMLVHHCGKDATKGMRGHSSLFAALDAAIEVTRDGDMRRWKVAKAKDGEDGKSHPFRLRVVDLGTDEDGDPVTSCVVEPDQAFEQVQQVRLPKGGNQRLVYDALRPLFKASRDFGKSGAPAYRPCLELEAAVAAASGSLTVEPRRRNERARQAVTGLIATGVLGCSEGWLWLK